MATEHRLLVMFDVPGWAYHNRALALQKYAPTDFRVEIAAWPELRDVPPHDIVFQLDSSVLRRFSDKPHVFSWNSDPNRRRDRWARTYASADWIVCNNRFAWCSYGQADCTCCISNGIDHDVYRPTVPIESRPERIFWTGSINSAKGKGYSLLWDAIPRLSELGFTIDAHGVHSASTAPFDVAGIVKAYNRSGYVLCLSDSDATPNTSLEGMSCGCCLVTTRVGNAMEFGVDGGNCVMIDRSVDGLIDGLLRARRNRVEIATAGMELMHSRWSYGPPGNRAAFYFHLFRELIAGRQPEPFCYSNLTPQEV